MRNLKKKILSGNFLNFVRLKSTDLVHKLNGFGTQAWVCNIIHWSLGKWFLTYWLPNIATFHSAVLKKRNVFANTTTYVTKVKNWDAVTFIVSGKFSKILIFAWRLEFITDDKESKFFSLKWQAHFILFEKMSAK